MRLRLAMVALAVGAVGWLHVSREGVLDLGSHLLHVADGVCRVCEVRRWSSLREEELAVSVCCEEKLCVCAKGER